MEYRTKSDYIYEKIKDDIIEGKLALGERLLISTLAQQYNVSAMPIREVINRLLQDGLVETIANVGARIVTFDKHKYKEIFFVEIELEALALKMAAESANDDLIKKLENIIAEMEDSLAKSDMFLYAKLNKKFHLAICEANPNTFLYETLVSLWNRVDLIRRTLALSFTRATESLAEHKLILQAVTDRDGERAVQAFRQHKANASKFYQKNFPTWGYNEDASDEIKSPKADGIA